MSNTIITAVQQLSENVIIGDLNNDVVCIDMENNRIGVKTSIPTTEIDVNGTITTDTLSFKTSSIQANHILYEDEYLKFQKSIRISEDISVNDLVDCSFLLTKDISSINIDVSTCKTNDLSSSIIHVRDIIVDNSLNLNFIDSVSKIISFSDCSLNNINNIDCTSISLETVTSDVSFTGEHYTFNSDISFIGGKIYDFSGTIQIDGSINIVYGGITTPEFFLLSDDRLKHNEKNIENGLEMIRKLEPQIYQKTKNFKAIDFSGLVTEPYILEAGLIAQDVEKINDLSFCVKKGDIITPYSLNYNNIFVYCLAAIKELDSRVNNINTLNKTNNLGNIEKFIQNQSLLIESLNSKISILEKKINTFEK